MTKQDNYSDWQLTSSKVFWGEVAPCEHVFQIYENDEIFVDVLSGFVGGGFNAGDCVVIIATEKHLSALEERLTSFGMHIDSLISNDQYIPLNAEKALSKFMVNGWPDEELFMKFVATLIKKARRHDRPVRAFGEMVAILWAQGLSGATVHLEYLWNKFCKTETFSLFCAYPKSGFTQDMNDSILNICCSHSKMITAHEKPMTELYYRTVEPRIAS
jgi:hypothetical protein